MKCIIDGDLCEKFSNLDITKQKQIAEELDRTPNEVVIFILNTKFEIMFNKLLFIFLRCLNA
jgi:hypothetical protein